VVVKDEFPVTCPGAKDVQQVVEILCTLFITENNPNLPLSDAVDNCFTLRVTVGQVLALGSDRAQVCFIFTSLTAVACLPVFYRVLSTPSHMI